MNGRLPNPSVAELSSVDVLIYVQHLLGTGHLRRIQLIARGLAASDISTRVVSGGMPLNEIDFGSANFYQLPPFRAKDMTFSALVDENGNEVGESWKHHRRDILLEVLIRSQPKIVIVEAYPFARRQLRFELLPLLERCQGFSPKPFIISSVRDILQEKKNPARVQESIEIAEQYFSFIWVHGDSQFVKLQESIPSADKLTIPIQYTGYIANPGMIENDADIAGQDEVIVSAGGGAASGDIYQHALAASTVLNENGTVWRLLVGNGVSEKDFQTLRQSASSNAIVERSRKDFLALLKNATVSVSQAGYNTMMDLAMTNTPAVLIPFIGSGETEQTFRAEKFAQLNRAVVLSEKTITPRKLANAVARAKSLTPLTLDIDLDGVKNCVNLTRRLLTSF